MTPMKWFYSFLKKYRWRMFWGIVLTTIVAACALVSPYVSKLIVDRVIQHEQYGMLKNLIIVLIVTIIIRGICRFFRRCFLRRVRRMFFTVCVTLFTENFFRRILLFTTRTEQVT